jgi:hypothetical protein
MKHNTTDCGFVVALENKVACKPVAYQGDGYRLQKCRLHSSLSQKRTGYPQTARSWEPSTPEHSVHFSWEMGKPSKLTIYLLRDFSVDNPHSKKRHNTNRDTTDLQYSPHRIGHHSSVKLLHAWPLVLLLPQGGTLVGNSKTHGLQISTKPEPVWIVHGVLQYATAILTRSQVPCRPTWGSKYVAMRKELELRAAP